VLVGGVALGVSSALTWVHTASGSVTGFGDYYLRQHATWVLLHGPATFVIIMAVGLVAVAVTTLWSGRIVALAIAGVVLSALALIWMAACAGFAAQTRTYLGGGTLGPGVGVGVAASLVSLCGSVWTLVRRGRPRSDSTATR